MGVPKSRKMLPVNAKSVREPSKSVSLSNRLSFSASLPVGLSDKASFHLHSSELRDDADDEDDL